MQQKYQTPSLFLTLRAAIHSRFALVLKRNQGSKSLPLEISCILTRQRSFTEMAKEKKATGEAPKKRTSRSKTPVAAAQPEAQQSPDNGSAELQQTGSNGNTPASTT